MILSSSVDSIPRIPICVVHLVTPHRSNPSGSYHRGRPPDEVPVDNSVWETVTRTSGCGIANHRRLRDYVVIVVVGIQPGIDTSNGRCGGAPIVRVSSVIWCWSSSLIVSVVRIIWGSCCFFRVVILCGYVTLKQIKRYLCNDQI